MSDSSWEYYIGTTEEIGAEEVNEIQRGGAKLLDVRGEVCPYPQIKAKEALADMTSGQVLVVYTDHVDAVATVPLGVQDLVSKTKVWKSGRGEYKILLWKK